MMANPMHLVGLFLTIVATGFHFCAIYVAVRSKELKTARFMRLVLFLSISDCAIGIGIVYVFILSQLDNSNQAVIFQCMLMKHIISGSVISSLMHTLLICIDRLNSTFAPKRRILILLTGNISVGICFAVPHCFVLVMFAINVFNGIVSCDQNNTIEPMALIAHDLPVALLVISIGITYGVVTKRMIKQQNSIGVQSTNLTEAQIKKKKAKDLRMRKNVLSLGMLIGVAVISSLPRGVIGLYAYVTGDYGTVAPYLIFSNSVLLLLTPLLDPIIYLFRIEKYRRLLQCKCCLRSNAVSDANE